LVLSFSLLSLGERRAGEVRAGGAAPIRAEMKERIGYPSAAKPPT